MTYTQLLNNPITIACVGFLMGYLLAWLAARERRINEGRIRYFTCKDCGREHALDQHGKWMALRTVEEVQAQEVRFKAAQARFANVPPVEKLNPVPHCLHGVPMDKDCPECHVVLKTEPQNPRRG